MRVIIFLALINTLIFIANIIYMNRITKEVYHTLERFASFKCLTKEFKEYDVKTSEYWFNEESLCVVFAIPLLNIVTLFVSVFNYDDMVKDISETTRNEFLNWVETKSK